MEVLLIVLGLLGLLLLTVGVIGKRSKLPKSDTEYLFEDPNVD